MLAQVDTCHAPDFTYRSSGAEDHRRQNPVSDTRNPGTPSVLGVLRLEQYILELHTLMPTHVSPDTRVVVSSTGAGAAAGAAAPPA